MGVDSLKGPLRIGLTGGIGSGKTTVSDLFAKLHVPVIDADIIAHDVVQKGQVAYDEIINEFGNEIIGDNGELDRVHLREIVFDNKEYKNRLESIIHPKVRKSLNERIHQTIHPYCVVSIPLLIESGLQNTVDRILVIDLPEKTQLERASQRDDVSKENIKKIILSQVGREERLKYADDIILNDVDVEYLAEKVAELDVKYIKLSKQQLSDH